MVDIQEVRSAIRSSTKLIFERGDEGRAIRIDSIQSGCIAAGKSGRCKCVRRIGDVKVFGCVDFDAER